MASSLELVSLTALPLRGLSSLKFISSLALPSPSLGLSPPFALHFPGGGGWASGGAICPVFAQPFAGDERILQVCRPLLFPCAVPDGAPLTLTKLFVFGSESSYITLPTNFDFVCKNYRSAPASRNSFCSRGIVLLGRRCNPAFFN